MKKDELEIKMRPVNSSNIATIGYDDKTNTLAVRFKNGKLYHYYGINKIIYTSLLSSQSLGSYLYQHVINKKIKFKQI
jgi:hypothetical protein